MFSSHSSPSLKICRNNRPIQSVISITNKLNLKFKSNQWISKSGIKLSIRSWSVNECPPEWYKTLDGRNCFKIYPERVQETLESSVELSSYAQSNLAYFDSIHQLNEVIGNLNN